MQLAETMRMTRIMENEKNEKIQNLREQLKSLQSHSYPQSMSSYPLITSYPFFVEQTFPNHHSRSYHRSFSVQLVRRSDFASSYSLVQSTVVLSSSELGFQFTMNRNVD